MGLGHVLGLDDAGERYLCNDCGRVVAVGDDEADEETACPECGSTDLKPLLRF